MLSGLNSLHSSQKIVRQEVNMALYVSEQNFVIVKDLSLRMDQSLGSDCPRECLCTYDAAEDDLCTNIHWKNQLYPRIGWPIPSVCISVDGSSYDQRHPGTPNKSP
mmetsp:Transcript_17478/g.20166  ORF Transcript_17478/g.20166 Transcript_17478/m.20166 type:complete len:106 (+) Transcript_17478:630-947(+)